MKLSVFFRYGLLARFSGLWHILRGHKVKWYANRDDICKKGDIICNTCRCLIWCRAQEFPVPATIYRPVVCSVFGPEKDIISSEWFFSEKNAQAEWKNMWKKIPKNKRGDYSKKIWLDTGYLNS